MNDEEKDDDDKINVNVDIEEILQQIISLNEENFEQMSCNFPSLKHIIRSAEKYQRSGIPEATFTKFHRSFPVSSEGPPGLGIAASPVVSWLGTFAIELKTFIATLSRKERQIFEHKTNISRDWIPLKSGFTMLKIALQLQWIANHSKLVCLKCYFEKSKKQGEQTREIPRTLSQCH